VTCPQKDYTMPTRFDYARGGQKAKAGTHYSCKCVVITPYCVRAVQRHNGLPYPRFGQNTRYRQCTYASTHIVDSVGHLCISIPCICICICICICPVELVIGIHIKESSVCAPDRRGSSSHCSRPLPSALLDPGALREVPLTSRSAAARLIRRILSTASFS